MAKFDIMPHRSLTGGVPLVVTAGMTAAETFNTGEPVGLDDAGTVGEPPQDGTEWLIADNDSGRVFGIACYGPGTSTLNPKTNVAWASGDEVAFWQATPGQLWKTRNFIAAGGASIIAPALTDIGESYQITQATSSGTPWGVEQTAGVDGTDVCAVVHDILDINGVRLADSPLTLSATTQNYWVIFEIRTSL